MARFTYARYVGEKLEGQDSEQQKETRKEYYSPRGRVIHYDEYSAFCRGIRHEADPPPADYYEWKQTPFVRPLLATLGGLGIMSWLLGGIIGGSTGRQNER